MGLIPFFRMSLKNKEGFQKKERIQKIVSNSGYCSRRKAEELIKEGKVRVNGKVVSLGAKANPQSDVISVEGKVVRPMRKVYFCFNKPKGLVCSNKDKKRTIFDYLYHRYPKLRAYNLYSVGRLDLMTRGLLFLTNDGDFSNFIMHPSNGIKKIYAVVLSSVIDSKDAKVLKEGFLVKDDLGEDLFKPYSVVFSGNEVEVTIGYGKKRIIRRAFAFLGYRVLDLVRIRIGSISLGSLREGEIRAISRKELVKLGYLRKENEVFEKYQKLNIKINNRKSPFKNKN